MNETHEGGCVFAPWITRSCTVLVELLWHGYAFHLQSCAQATVQFFFPSPRFLSQMCMHNHEARYSEEFGHISKDSFCMSWSTGETGGPYSCLEQYMQAADSVQDRTRTTHTISIYGSPLTNWIPEHLTSMLTLKLNALCHLVIF